jgi:hypothetical protein
VKHINPGFKKTLPQKIPDGKLSDIRIGGMAEEWITVSGFVVPGHRVASGPSRDYPYGSLVKQIPYFQALGLEVAKYYPGTINISISPRRWRMLNPEFTFRNVVWTNLHPPEDFSFSFCRIHFLDTLFEGWVYYPHPETKTRHFQDPSMIEVITKQIIGIGYGSKVSLELKAGEISLEG